MNPDQITLLFWNGDKASSLSLFEEMLLVGQKSGMLQAFLSEAPGAEHFRVGSWAKDSHNILQKTLKQSVLGYIPYVSRNQLHALIKAAQKNGFHTKLANLRFFITGEEALLSCCREFTPRILCMIKPDSSAAAFIYSILKKIKTEKEDYPEVFLIIRDTVKLEDAAVFFATVSKDLTNLLGFDFALHFVGHLALSEEKLIIASKKPGVPLADLFPEDALHGQMKYCAKQLAASAQLSQQDQMESFLRITSALSACASNN